jgi:hypothetical protein
MIRAKTIIIGLITISIALSIFYIFFIALEPEIPKTTITETPVNVFAVDEQSIKSEFNQIHKTKFSITKNNCTTKSKKFGNYLINHGAINVKTMNIGRLDGQYGHEVILWNNKVYDATSGLYDTDLNQYLNFVYSKGFNGLIIIQDFRGA